MNTAQKEVLRNIMYAVETGGQVYGERDYADFTEAYTNSDSEHAITIGAGQWYATEARKLLQRIRQADSALFTRLDTAGIALDLANADWTTYKLSKGSPKANCIVSIIDTSVGHNCQDAQLDEQMAAYVYEAYTLGATSPRAQGMCANFRHQGGKSAMVRILNKTPKPYTLDNLYEACKTDTGNQVGTYLSRQKFVYENLKSRMVEDDRISDVIALVKSREGKNYYSQDGSLRLKVFDEPTGYSDCSSLQMMCFKKAANINIGDWTGAQIGKGSHVWSNPGDSHTFTQDLQAASGAVPGDLVFWGNSASDTRHVEMYLGNNQLIGHGSGWGPTIKTASAYRHGYRLLQVRRYLEGGGSTPPEPTENGVYLIRFVPE